VNVVHDLTSRGVGLRVLTGQGAAIDTTTPAGKLVFGIFASLAEFERDLISERTRVGLASASARASPTEVLTTLLYGSFILSPDALRLVQQKTGEELWVPLHPDLGTALEGWDSSPYVINRKRRVVHSSALQERLGRLHEWHACRQDQTGSEKRVTSSMGFARRAVRACARPLK
jgi:hypothetical protein